MVRSCPRADRAASHTSDREPPCGVRRLAARHALNARAAAPPPRSCTSTSRSGGAGGDEQAPDLVPVDDLRAELLGLAATLGPSRMEGSSGLVA
jgi:hypothetical protein